jgi:hypothetical protein
MGSPLVNRCTSPTSYGFACPGAGTTLCWMQLLAGAVLERPPGPKYTSELRFAELAPRSPLPKGKTLAKWRSELGDAFELGLRIPEPCWNTAAGPLRPSADLDEGLRWLFEATDALEPSLLVLATAARVSTGARDRDRLRSFIDRLPRRAGTRIVWRATGLWEPESLQSLASSLGIMGGFDPLDDPPPRGDLVYASLTAEGIRRSFSHALLLTVLDRVSACHADFAYVTIDSPQSFFEARLLQSLSEGRE